MKRRRILALLLALSLAVSMNGMTVLAAGTDETIVTDESAEGQTLDVTQGNSENEGQKDADESEQTSGTESTDSENTQQEDSASNTDDHTGTDEEKSEGSEDLEGSAGSDLDTDETTVEDSETDETTEEDPDTVEVPEEENEETEETEEESVEEAEPAAQPAVIRMVTFTDDTGMRITYDANEAATYQYNVVDGVLIGVKDQYNNDLSGEVVLSQPTDDSYDTFTSIASDVFAGNTNITYVKIPSGVTSISAGAFSGCTALKGVYIPNKVASIGASAFEGCSSLTQLAIPKSVTEIGNKAFYGDTKLFMVHMKDVDYSALATIGDEAFYNCSSLEKFCSDTEFNFPESITTVGASAFNGCSQIPKVIMGDGVTSIGASAFANCYSIVEVTLSSGLESIPECAFENCTGLQSVTFGNNNLTKNTKIEGYAFKNCSSLGSIELPDQVNEVAAYAFAECSGLQRVYVKYGRATLEANAFPNGNQGICLVGTNGSTASAYAADAGIRFVAVDDSVAEEYYTYTAKLSGVGTDVAKPITIKVTNTASASSGTADINTLNGGKGVKAGSDLYIYILDNGNSYAQLVPGSLKCNGKEITKVGNNYHTTMPIGGAVITAEFEYKEDMTSKTIAGSASNVSAELSNGSELKVGQTTRLFLTSNHPKDENLIPTSKITYSISSTASKKVASVSADGTIKALAAGTTVIVAEVKNSAGDKIPKTVTINVSEADVDSIKIKASNYDTSDITISTGTDSTQSASIDSSRVTKAYTITLKATAYDADDDSMAVAFKWTSSDTKVAKLAAASTTAASPTNTVTIPAYTNGEATITVTATNADKTTVTENFIIRVKDYTPRLSASSITINPNQTEGAVLQVIEAYHVEGRDIDLSSVELYEEKEDENLKDFTLTYDGSASTDTVSTFRVKARSGLANGTYNRRLKVQVHNTIYKIPVKITVKASTPSPKVAFVKNQPKLDLFQKKSATEFNINVTNLGQEQVATYSLKALTTSEDDRLFTENFRVEYVDGSNCTITQKSEALLYTSKNKPAVTGYLVLTFEGYNSTITKEFKITIPTQTVTPSYVLSRTSGTYYAGCDAQYIDVQLLDKKNKNAVVDLGNADNNYNGYTVSVRSDGTRAVTKAELFTNNDGETVIRMSMTANPTAGKVYLVVGNASWAKGKTFTYTYTIKTSTATPKITLKNSSVTLNPSYPKQTAAFELKSNQTDTVISDSQEFHANVNSKSKASLVEEYEKLEVKYENGIGTVSIKNASIANGTYTFICDSAAYEYGGSKHGAGKLTLKVKIAKAVPTVTAKGTLSFNTLASVKQADGSYQYVENAKLVFTTKNLPEGYVFDEEAMLGSIVCSTRGCESYADRFDWALDKENKTLQVSMSEWCPNKTYSFSIIPTFTDGNENGNTVAAKKLTFKVKVYSGNIAVSLSAKGKLNLLDRTGDPTTANSIVYTPKFTNLKDQVVEAKVYDADSAMPVHTDKESDLFEVTVSEEGLLYVRPKADAELENNKTYKIAIWMKLKDYTAFPDSDGNGTWSKTLSIKTAQTLPKVTTDKSTVNLYLSNKNYGATFIVDKQEVKSVKPVGKLTGIAFGESDTKALESFVNDEGVITSVEPLEDGSLKVTLKLNDTVSYSCNTTNKIKMYVVFDGQGTNTAGTAITMNVVINK